MSLLIGYSEPTLNVAIHGEFEKLSLEIISYGNRRVYTLLNPSELRAQGKSAHMLTFVIPLLLRGAAITWGTTREIRECCKKIILDRLSSSASMKVIRTFLKLTHEGCLLSQKYEMEISHLHPQNQGLSFYYRQLFTMYKQYCSDPTLDLVSWYRTDEGRALLQKETGKSNINEFRVLYPSREERKQYAAEFTTSAGKIVLHVQGKPLKTLTEKEKTLENSLSIFVMGYDGMLYVAPHVIGVLQHSSFFGGLPVISAGEIVTNEEGRILYLSNRSGHYTPNLTSTLNLLRVLKKKGVDLSTITLLVHDFTLGSPRRGRYNALQFLESKGQCPRISNGTMIQSEDGSTRPDYLMLA